MKPWDVNHSVATSAGLVLAGEAADVADVDEYAGGAGGPDAVEATQADAGSSAPCRSRCTTREAVHERSHRQTANTACQRYQGL